MTENYEKIRKLLNLSTIEEAKDFFEDVVRRTEIFGTPFVCNKCVEDLK